jgi:hypothetical protein
MTCAECDRLLADFADDALAPSAAAHVEAHLLGCRHCQATAADVRTIRLLARSLEPHLPPARVWQRLSDTVRAERPSSLAGMFAGWRHAAAAAMTVTIVTGLWWVGDRLATVAAPASVFDIGGSSSSAAGHGHRTAERGYTTSIARLEALTEGQRATLDPEMADVLDTGMTIIDTAIDQSRAALASAPDSEVARQSLFQALRSKVELLQDTLALINDMRSGAERIAAEMNP